MKSIAIMQPTYLPWLGYFSLMKSVDEFVILDSVQFSKRSWQQRNKIKTQNGEQFLTVPVFTKDRREQLINEALIDTGTKVLSKHEKTIEHSYEKAEYYSEFKNKFNSIFENPPDKLIDLNMNLIEIVKNAFSITTPIIFSSELEAVGKKAELLFSICEKCDADTYISPPGSKVYLDESSVFQQSDVELKYINFICEPYKQLHGDFLPYMAAIDCLFNLGANGKEFLDKSHVC